MTPTHLRAPQARDQKEDDDQERYHGKIGLGKLGMVQGVHEGHLPGDPTKCGRIRRTSVGALAI